MDNLIIRREEPWDYETVEFVTREAFWNQNVPGCEEHYLAHVLRGHSDFIPELDLVAELNGQIIGNVMYTKSRLTDEAGEKKTILTFGPISVHPDYQRRGVSRALLERSFDIAREMGYDLVVIFGNPENYIPRGFRSCMKYNICVGHGIFPTAMMVKELVPGILDGRRWQYEESPAYVYDSADAEAFDVRFPAKEKKWQVSQEAFYIYSHSTQKN